jgi:hypothetical protein
VEATIDGRTFGLRPPAEPGGYWEGTLPRAGLLSPGARLHVIPDAGRYFWEGRHQVNVTVDLTADGRSAKRTVNLHPGYG